MSEAATRRGAALVFAGALAARLAVIAWAAPRIPPVADGSFYHTIATRIAQGLGYTWLWPDGAVTYAGHYPVGYPAMVGAAYWLAGPHPPAAMLMNALLGSLAAVAAYALAGRAAGRRAGIVAGTLVAIHPGLLAYTPALMTEGVTAALIACGAWAALGGAASEARRGDEPAPRRSEGAPPKNAGWKLFEHGRGRAVLAGVVIGIATLVRPQSLVLAPIFGWLAAVAAERVARSAPDDGGGGSLDRLRNKVNPSSWQRAIVRWAVAAALALGAALAVCAPWSVRNCVQMKRCALVSYNGGWNLLIGADEASTGTWAEIKVPAECREVFDEAEKDVCFGAAARRYIAEHPGAWLALAPKKLAATFDYAGAGPWYLHAANPAAFSEDAKKAVGAIETVFERLTLILALLAAARAAWSDLRSARRVLGVVLVVLAAIGLAASWRLHAWIAYVALGLALLAGAVRRDEGDDEALLRAAAAAVLLSLAATHAVFFGAGRYSLVAFPFVTTVAALLAARRRAGAAAE